MAERAKSELRPLTWFVELSEVSTDGCRCRRPEGRRRARRARRQQQQHQQQQRGRRGPRRCPRWGRPPGVPAPHRRVMPAALVTAARPGGLRRHCGGHPSEGCTAGRACTSRRSTCAPGLWSAAGCGSAVARWPGLAGAAAAAGAFGPLSGGRLHSGGAAASTLAGPDQSCNRQTWMSGGARDQHTSDHIAEIQRGEVFASLLLRSA